MKRFRSPVVFGLMFGVALLVFGVVAYVSSHVTNAASGTRSFSARPLTTASPIEVGQVALNYVKGDFPIRSGTPTVVLAQPVKRQDLPAMGLGSIDSVIVEEPPLMLVILKGDFGAGEHLGPGGSSQTSQRYQYIGYVYNLWAGVPTLTLASPDGGIFRTALRDTTLPIVPTRIPAPPHATPITRLHYGDVAPTAVPAALPGNSGPPGAVPAQPVKP